MSINPNTRTSVQRVIGNVARNLELRNPKRYEDSFVEWAFDAMRFIGSSDTFPRMELDLTITDKRVALPNNLISIIDVQDEDGNYLEPTSATFRGNKEPSSNPNYSTSLTKDNIPSASRYYIDNGGDSMTTPTTTTPLAPAYINVNLADSTKITISYYFLEVDVLGYPLIKEGHEEAIASYIMWKYKSIEYFNGKLPQYVYKDLESRWYWLCGQARGYDNLPTPQEWERVGSIWNSLIPVKTFNGLLNY